MNRFRIQAAAAHRLDEIYAFTAETWGEAQADHYLEGLFAKFEAISSRDFPWRPLSAAFGVEGYVCRYERHLIYWRLLADGRIGIVTVLHERMHQISRLRDDFA